MSTASPSTEVALAASMASDDEFISLVKLAARTLFCDLPVGSAGKTIDVLDAFTSLKDKGTVSVDGQEQIIHPNSYCSLDYAKVYEFVKHQIKMITDNLKSDLNNQNHVQEYICTQCERRYSAFDALYLISTIDHNFHCEACDKSLQPVDGEGRRTAAFEKLKKSKEDLGPLLLSIERLKGTTAPAILPLQQWRENSLVELATDEPSVPSVMAVKHVSFESTKSSTKLKTLPLWMIREGGVNLTEEQRNYVKKYVIDIEAD